LPEQIQNVLSVNNEIVNLNDTMSHRGPDNSTVKEYKLKNKNLFICHNRLSIQDLATHANQPMENDRYTMVFNGEVYNHLEIRKKLTFNNFKTTSDTETILFAFIQLGVEKAISMFIGMFAIALYDKVEEKLYLIRDRVGIKPLYWTYQNNEFAFGSELKGFANHLKNKKSDKALIQFMSFGYIPNDNSYYENIHKLKPAHYLVFDGKSVDIKRYWDLPKDKIDVSYEEAVDETERLIRSSVKYRLLADVEVGSFLSGGVDSSLVSAIMQQESNKKIKTFSIGFEDKRYDESVYAKEVAKHIDSEHFEYKFKASDVIGLIDKLDYHFDEPFGDDSSLPMMLLSQKTKEQVSVVLSGDGGDELFGGYNRYFLSKNIWSKIGWMPPPVKQFISHIIYSIPNNILNKGFNWMNPLFEKYGRPGKPSDKFKKLVEVLSVKREELLYKSLVSHWKTPNRLVLNSSEPKTIFDEFKGLSYISDFYEKMMLIDLVTYLVDDILTKVDRASMSVSLEARVPILDHRVVEFSKRVPLNMILTRVLV
jgi:asparagine synthase (glutamine-hydrolysing)